MSQSVAQNDTLQEGELWVTWCSFADDEKCRGVLILEGNVDPVSASMMAHSIGQNPGGQLLTAPVALRQFPQAEQGRVLENVGKLLSVEEASGLFEIARVGDSDE